MGRIVIALFDNLSVDDEQLELLFREGDLLWISGEDAGEGWLTGKLLCGQVSVEKLIPSGYVGDLPINGKAAKVDFTISADDETELSAEEGEILHIVHDINEDWFVGRNEAGILGLVPANYISKIVKDQKANIESVESPKLDFLPELNEKVKVKQSIDESQNVLMEKNHPINNGKVKSNTSFQQIKNSHETSNHVADWVKVPPSENSDTKSANSSAAVIPRYKSYERLNDTEMKLEARSNNSRQLLENEQKQIPLNSDKRFKETTGNVLLSSKEIESEHQIVKPTPKPEAPKFRLPEVKLKSINESVLKAAEVVQPKVSPKFVEKKKKNELRVWTSRTGSSKLEATYYGVSEDDKKVLLEKPDEKIIQVVLDSLSNRDIEYVNQIEGRAVMKLASDTPTKIEVQSKKPVIKTVDSKRFIVNGFNWLTFLSNNTKLQPSSVDNYAEIFAKNNIGENELMYLDGKKIALMGVKIDDMEQVMDAIGKMKKLIRESGEVEEKISRTRISEQSSSKTKTTIMIPQFAIEDMAGKKRTTVTVEKGVNEPIVTKVIEPEPIVYEVRRSNNASQPNMSIANRPTSPGIVHRNSINSPPHHQMMQQTMVPQQPVMHHVSNASNMANGMVPMQPVMQPMQYQQPYYPQQYMQPPPNPYYPTMQAHPMQQQQPPPPPHQQSPYYYQQQPPYPPYYR